MADTQEELQRRAQAGEWLGPGDAAILLGTSRSTVIRMLDADPPVFKYRVKTGTGRHRTIDPVGLLAELAKQPVVHDIPLRTASADADSARPRCPCCGRELLRTQKLNAAGRVVPAEDLEA